MTIPWLGTVKYATIPAKRAFSVTLGKMLQTSPRDPADFETPYLKSSSVQWSGVVANPDNLMWASREEINDLRVRSGDLLVSEGGDVGRCVIFQGPAEYILQNSVHRVRGHGQSEVRYLRYVLEALHGSGWLDVICNKATIRHLTSEKLENLEIPMPSSSEQARIVHFLDGEIQRIESARGRAERVLEVVEERYDAAFSSSAEKVGGLLLHELDEDPRGSKEWEWIRLSKLLTKLTNGHVGPTRDILVDRPGVPYVQSLHIKQGRVDFARRPYYVHEEWAASKPRIILRSGDLLIVQTGAIGEVALVDDSSAGASCHALLIARVDPSKISERYLFSLLRGHFGRNLLLREQTGALHPHLEAGKVRDICLPVPAFDIQERIAARCSEIYAELNEIRASVSNQLALLAERRRALIAAAITGKIDVAAARGIDI